MPYGVRLLVIAVLLMARGAASAEVVLVPTTSLTLRDDGGARRVTFKSVTKRELPAARIVPPPPGGVGDPTRSGATLVIENAAGSGERTQLALPAARWKALGTAAKPKGYQFRDRTSGAPVKKAVLKANRMVVAGGGTAFGYTLDEAQQLAVALRLQSGAAAWCAAAPARAIGNPPSTGKHDRPGRFVAQPRTPPPATCPAGLPMFDLTVLDGHGSGRYPAGATVHVWAAVQPQTQLVTGWTGDADLLADPAEWHTTLAMPARDATVGATIADRPTTLETSTFTGVTGRAKTVHARIPPAARGLVLFLHGTGGSSAFITRTEPFAVALRALEAGYGVLATEAEEAVAGDLNGDGRERWDPALSATNLDLANLDGLIATLRAAGTVGATTPLFALGMSNGGAMAVSLGAVGASAVAAAFPNLRFVAVVSHCADARAAAVAVTTTPTAWFMCANDDNPQVSNAEAEANSAALAARGVPTVFAAHPPSPLYDQRFAREPGLDLPTSFALSAELRAAGFVGPDGFFALPSADMVAAVTADPGLMPSLVALPGGAQRRVLSQIAVMQAEHEMFSDWAARTVRFFDTHAP